MHTTANMDVKGSCSPAHHLHPPRRARMTTQGWSRADLEPEGLMSALGPHCKFSKVSNGQRMAWRIYLYKRCDPDPRYAARKIEWLNTGS